MNISRKCLECGEGNQLNQELFPNLTITYFSCGHRSIEAVVNETINITEKIGRDIHEDYAELGQIYLGGALFAKKINFVEKGKIRFEENREKLYQFLCIENQICEKIKKIEKHDVLTLFSTVGGLLIGSTIMNPLIPVGVVTSIIIKIGIKKFCRCEHD